MADNNKVKIWIQLADASNPIALSIAPDEEENYRKAEELVNTLWKKWMTRFGGESADVLGRVAFQFARLYLEAYGENREVNEFLQRGLKLCPSGIIFIIVASPLGLSCLMVLLATT